MCTKNTTKEHTANNPVSNTPKDPMPSYPAPPNDSATTTAVTYKANSIAE